MANNVDVFAKVAQEISPSVLRQICIAPRIAAKNFNEQERARKGEVINYTRVFDGTVRDVTPGAYAPASQDVNADNVAISLNQWKESNFNLTDQEWCALDAGLVLPGTYASRIKAIANYIEDFLFEKMILGIPNRVGDAATTPSDLSLVSQAVAKLNGIGADQMGRMLALHSDYAATLRTNQYILQRDSAGTFEGLRSGYIGDLFGFETAEAPRLGLNTYKTITTGTHNTAVVVNNVAGYAQGSSSVVVDTGTGTAKKGETFSFAGHDQKYVVTADVADLSAGTISFFPSLKEDVADGEAISFDVAASTTYKIYGVGAAPECAAFISRAWNDRDSAEVNGMGEIRIISDPATGIVMRLSRVRGYKQSEWSVDVLFGGGVFEANNGVLLIGKV